VQIYLFFSYLTIFY